tara:strand:- start:600 stop:863 length:264 start_codon:yes stop_codon:yes gene_type:complete
MKQFLYKTAIVILAIVLIYEFTISKQINQITSQTETLLSKEGRKEGVEKLRKEIKKAVNKERYLSKEDAELLKQFIDKITKEISQSE